MVRHTPSPIGLKLSANFPLFPCVCLVMLWMKKVFYLSNKVQWVCQMVELIWMLLKNFEFWMFDRVFDNKIPEMCEKRFQESSRIALSAM